MEKFCMFTRVKKLRKLFFLRNVSLSYYCFFLFLLPFISSNVFANITGTVFRDFPVNGTTLGVYGNKHASEPGVEGVTVSAYDTSGAVVSTSLTAANGSYSLTTAAGDYRVEFSIWPTYLQESPDANGLNTSVQFVSDGTSVNFGLHNPADYTDSVNPELISSIFVNGAAVAAGGPSDQGGILSWPYLNSGAGGATETSIANEQEVGSVWGIAYDKKRAKIYAATMVKRHAGILNNQLGRIYEVNADGTGTSVFIDIPNAGTIADDATRGLGDPGVQNRDPDAIAAVLKVGLGDIDISDDQSTLYAMNLNDKKLYQIDVQTKTISNSFATPNPCNVATGENRPFAVEAVDEKVFIGVVCDASISGATSDLTAHIYEFDGVVFTSIYQHTLNYARESTPDDQGWNAWSDNYQSIAQVYTGSNFWKVVVSQPVLADIKFDDTGNLIVGYMDRVAFQGGFQNLPPAGVPFDNNLEFKTISGGDILIATPDGTGQYIVNPIDTDANAGNESVNADDSPVTDHKESALGAVTIFRGSGEVAMVAYDPFGSATTSFHTAGVVFFNPANGNKNDAYKVMDNTAPQVAHFGKGAGMGDIELLTTLAPVEIGNRVWEDTDGDGVQDAGELGIGNVTIELVDNATSVVIATAVTNSNGDYIFSNNPLATTTASHIYNISALNPNTSYIVRIPNATGTSKQAVLGNSYLTVANTAGQGGQEDSNDSDGVINVNDAEANVIPADISISGANNHSFDFGFVPPPEDWGDAPDPAYLTLKASNGPHHVLDPNLFMGACADDESNGLPNANADGDDMGVADTMTVGTCVVANNDEDSLVPPLLADTQVAPSVDVTVINATASDATLACWVDYNSDGTFDNATERGSIVVSASGIATVILPDVPATASTDTGGSTFMRCRIASNAAEVADAIGAAANGEVEDYPILINPSQDWGDAPDTSVGNGSGDYSTLVSDNGPRHTLDATLFMGTCVDDEVNGQQSANADGDDSGASNINTYGTCATANDDEDSLTPPSLQDGQVAPSFNVSVVNTTGADATLACWIDYNGDGVFNNATERGAVTVANAATSATITMPNVPATAVADTGGASYMRCRIATLSADVANSTGSAANGEVEDYSVNFSNSDFGDAPDSYGTLLASTGAEHSIVAGLQIGATIDAEADGQPNAAANGDGADEDGVTIPTLVDGDALTLNPIVTNTTGSAANLVCWIDYNGNGTFELGESGTATVPNGTNAAAIAVVMPAIPSTASTDTSGSSYARCRLTTGALTGSTPTGLFADGEVEDYAVSIIPLQDWGDAPDSGAGNGVGDYSTLITDNGPHHILTTDLFMGACVDDEANGQQNIAADGDDTGVASANTNGTCATANDDEDSLIAPLLSDGQIAPTLDIAVHNTTGVDASLACWLDYNGDGVFDNAGERTATATVANGATTATVTLPDVPATASTTTGGTSYMRCRMATIATEVDNSTGAAASGEVEDYQITLIVATDWGDAPDTSVGNAAGDYSTLSNDNGPSHTLDANLLMGVCVDDELDGQQNVAADGDDNGTALTVTHGTCATANDDEDAIIPPLLLDQQIAPTIDVAIINTTANSAMVACWIDYNGDGVFDNASERGSNTINASGTVTITMPDVPATANADTGGSTYLRCRTASNAADVANSTGSAVNGEVEDYPITIDPLNKLGDYVWYDNDQNGLQDVGEPGVNGITVELFTNATCTAPSSQTTVTANGGLPAADGWYEFTDLPAGDYCVQFSGLAPGWVITSQNQGGDDTLDSDADAVTGQIQNITLTADDPTNDMGIYAAIGNILGQVYCDANLSLTYDAGEEQSGIAVTLLRDSDCDGTGDVTVATLDTDGTGSFDFTSLPVGLSPIPPNPAVCYVLNYDLTDADLTGCSEPFLPVTSVVELSTDIPSAPPIEFGNHVGPPLMIPVNKWWALMLLSALILLYARRFKQN